MIPCKSIISWSLRAGKISETITEIQTERGVPGRDGRTAAMKVRRLRAESPQDNTQDIEHHHFMMFDGSGSHCEMKGCDLVYFVEELSQPAMSTLNY